MVYDTLPRVSFLVVGAMTTAFYGSAYWAAGSMLVGSCMAVALSTVHVFRRYGIGRKRPWKEYATVAQSQAYGTGIAVFSVIYTTVPLLALSLLSPAAIAAYALADRVKQQSIAAVTPVAQALQGWVPRATERSDMHRRVRYVLYRALGLGGAAGALFAVLAPIFAVFLGAGVVSVEFSLSLPLGIAFGLNVITLIVGSSCLIPLGAKTAVFWSAVGGALIVGAFFSILIPLQASQPVAIAYVVAIAQAGVMIVQLTALVRLLRARDE